MVQELGALQPGPSPGQPKHHGSKGPERLRLSGRRGRRRRDSTFDRAENNWYKTETTKADADHAPQGALTFGAVAQLGARLHGMQEVAGSTPDGSTRRVKDEVRRKQEQVLADLEGQLAKTRTLGLRNAIRLTLKDLYKARGDNEKVLGHLRKMIEENDAALSKERRRRPE